MLVLGTIINEVAMNKKIKITAVLIYFVSIVCLSISCMQKPRLAIAQTNLDVLENKYGRMLVNKDANKVVGAIAKGDTFLVLDQNRDAETDFFTYYKVETKKNKIKGYLFEKDSFDIPDVP